jgi:membrane protein YqaA with SNARE-associated domain
VSGILAKLQAFGARILELSLAMGPWGPFLVALADSALIPMPQGVDALIIAHAAASPNTVILAAVGAVVGSWLGSLILYGMGRAGGRALLERRISAKSAERIHSQLDMYGIWAVFLPALIPLPLPMKPFVLGAGVFGMNWMRFSLALIAGRVVRYVGAAVLVLLYGEAIWDSVKQRGWLIALAVVAFIAASIGMQRWTKRRYG